MLRLQPPVGLVDPGHLGDGVLERLEHRDAVIPVLVRLPRALRERGDEMAPEDGLVPLPAAAGRGDHRPPFAGEGGDEAAARRGGVDERDPLRLQPLEQQIVVFGGQVAPRQIEPRLAVLIAAVPDQQNQHVVVRLGPLRDVRHRRFDVLARRPAVHPVRVDVGLLGQPDHIVGGQLVPLGRRVDQRRRPPVELLRIGGIAAETGDDENVGLLGGGRARQREQGQRGRQRPPEAGKTPGHASPRARRYPHSPTTSVRNSSSTAGMSHRSRSSITVTPPPTVCTSSASPPIESAV